MKITMITEDFVSRETAILLKEKGFHELVRYEYHNTTPSFHRHLKDFNGQEYEGLQSEWYSAPTYQMAMKWLREVHHIIFVFKPEFFSGDECTYWTYELWCGDNFEGEILSFKTYEQAVEAALKYCLENLI